MFTGDTMKYLVSGSMKIKGVWKAFVKEMEAASEPRVREMVFTNIGSGHRLKRTQIKITSVEARTA